MSGDKNRYKQYRNAITRLVRISKREYLQTYFENNMTNMKKTWDGINSLINNKRKQRKQISALKDDSNRGVTVNDPQILPNIMNRHFSTVGINLALNVPHSNISSEYYLNDVSVCNSFFFRPVISAEIVEEINSLSSNKTYGFYSVPTKILKSAKYLLSVPLAQLINIDHSTMRNIYRN